MVVKILGEHLRHLPVRNFLGDTEERSFQAKELDSRHYGLDVTRALHDPDIMIRWPCLAGPLQLRSVKFESPAWLLRARPSVDGQGKQQCCN